ncbi:MAG: hypothetical protein Q6356_002410 [Candidatus Wukongarchaeota archaeon]|nr:hypothetical protein [Candidatus Wukongarchaeota archaeon]
MKDEIKMIEKEAERNLEVGRWKDSASAFEYLMREKMKINDLKGALESAAKALFCWQKLEDITRSAKLLEETGIMSFKHAAEFFEIIAKEDKRIFERAAKCYAAIGDIKRMKQSLKKALKVYFGEAESLIENNKCEEALRWIEGAIRCYKKLGDKEGAKKSLTYKAECHEKLAKEFQEKNGAENEYLAAREYENAAKTYKKLRKRKKANEMIEKSKKAKEKAEKEYQGEFDPLSSL